MFKFLSMAQVAALSAADLKTYNEGLEAFEAAHPTGIIQVVAKVRDIATMPVMHNNKPVVAFQLDIADETIASGISGTNGLMLRPLANANVIANNAKFNGIGHFALVLASCFDKGSFTLDITINRKGETWTGKGGKTGTYKATGLSIRNWEYVPSVTVAGSIAAATQKVNERAFEAMYQAANSFGQQPVAAQSTADEPIEAPEVNA